MKTLTDQQKLEILCAYLAHGVEVQSDQIYEGFRTKLVIKNNSVSLKNGLTISDAIEYEARPILRHPDDMTEEELRVFASLAGKDKPFFLSLSDDIRYLHSIHIDTFGAIEAGFAVRKNINEKGE
jgi:hypothetical protein